MADPYRSFDDARSPRARVLGGPNRLRTAWHLVLLAGLLGLAAWVATTSFGQRMPWLVALFVAPVVLDVVRTVHEAVLPHRIIADDRGIELVWAEKAPWRPFMRRRSAAIAWDELLGVRTNTLSINGIETTDLYIAVKTAPTLTIPPGTFAPNAHAIQQAILDERDDHIEAPRREAANVAGFCSAAFATPRVLRRHPNPWARPLGTVFAVLVLVLGTSMGTAIGGIAHLLLTAPAVLVGGILVAAIAYDSAPRVLRLDADGLAYGVTDARLTLVPWAKVRFARPSVVNGVTSEVRVAVHDGDDLHLRGDYGVGLEALAVMISPPVGVVLRARERGAVGTDRAASLDELQSTR